jgi:hypothetical protein
LPGVFLRGQLTAANYFSKYNFSTPVKGIERNKTACAVLKTLTLPCFEGFTSSDEGVLVVHEPPASTSRAWEFLKQASRTPTGGRTYNPGKKNRDTEQAISLLCLEPSRVASVPPCPRRVLAAGAFVFSMLYRV